MKKETNTEETLIMRIYRPCTEGFVNHESYEKVSVVPTQAFPQGTFLMKNDYAIEKPDGTLSWLQAARLYKGEEYAEFSNLEGFEKRGEVFWRK